MKRILTNLGRSQRLAVVRELKLAGPLAVRALAKRMGMSYMGVRQQCVLLEKAGYLQTQKNRRPAGRPELLYTLTKKADDLFEGEGSPFALGVLNAAAQLFGSTAPQKLLFVYFRERTEAYAKALRGKSVLARARGLARLRDREGYLARLEIGEDGAMQIVERHSPIADLLAVFPAIAKLEEDQFSAILGVPVRRAVVGDKVSRHVVFAFITPSGDAEIAANEGDDGQFEFELAVP